MLPIIINGDHHEFKKNFGHLDCLDPYTLEKVDLKTTSIEHIHPYSYTSMDLLLDLDFQNMCFVSKYVNSIRNNNPLTFNAKNKDKTTKIYSSGTMQQYSKSAESIDDYATLELHDKKVYFSPPLKARGFIARRIIHCILLYLDSSSDNFLELYKESDMKNILRVLSNDYNIGHENTFEFQIDDRVKELQNNPNLCLRDTYNVIKYVFGRTSANHKHLVSFNGK
jgi:hypothetical protein